MIDAFACVHNWFRTNLLALNVKKPLSVQFKTKNKFTTDINIVCNNCPITMSNIKFLVLYCIYFGSRNPEDIEQVNVQQYKPQNN
jgi:hypothetical protein